MLGTVAILACFSIKLCTLIVINQQTQLLQKPIQDVEPEDGFYSVGIHSRCYLTSVDKPSVVTEPHQSNYNCQGFSPQISIKQHDC